MNHEITLTDEEVETLRYYVDFAFETTTQRDLRDLLELIVNQIPTRWEVGDQFAWGPTGNTPRTVVGIGDEWIAWRNDLLSTFHADSIDVTREWTRR